MWLGKSLSPRLTGYRGGYGVDSVTSMMTKSAFLQLQLFSSVCKDESGSVRGVGDCCAYVTLFTTVRALADCHQLSEANFVEALEGTTDPVFLEW